MPRRWVARRVAMTMGLMGALAHLKQAAGQGDAAAQTGLALVCRTMLPSMNGSSWRKPGPCREESPTKWLREI